MIYQIRNNTENDIEVGGIIFQASSTTKIFDDSIGLFDPSIRLIKYFDMEVGVLVTKGDLDFLVDSVSIGSAGFYPLVAEWKEKLEGFPIPYLSLGRNAYFHLSENKLRIRNSLSGKWYEVQLVEVAE